MAKLWLVQTIEPLSDGESSRFGDYEALLYAYLGYGLSSICYASACILAIAALTTVYQE